jgi:hypothetical protein
MKLIASIITAAIVLSYSLPVIAQGLVVTLDSETCVLRGGKPISDTTCRLPNN